MFDNVVTSGHRVADPGRSQQPRAENDQTIALRKITKAGCGDVNGFIATGRELSRRRRAHADYSWIFDRCPMSTTVTRRTLSSIEYTLRLAKPPRTSAAAERWGGRAGSAEGVIRVKRSGARARQRPESVERSGAGAGG
jgi:hypothetical protein